MDPQNFLMGGLFQSSTYLKRDVLTSLEKQLDHRGPIAPRVGPYQYFKRNPYPLKMFQGGSGPAVPHLDQRMGSYHVNKSLLTE